jgi:hypothetical protein
MLDFKELPETGTDFELLIRELAFTMGYRVLWSGKGPDAGSDLLLDEVGDPALGAQTRRWLVSCKHYAHSGRAVGQDDLNGILEACKQHSAKGFLLACTTHPSSAATKRLADLASDDLATHCWDSATLERLLTSPLTWPVAQAFCPRSAGETRVWATESPNVFVAACDGHRIVLVQRIGSVVDLALGSVLERVDRFSTVTLPPNHELRMRALWVDDKHGNYRWYADYLVPSGHDPALTRDELALRLGDGKVGPDGQFDSWDLAVRTVLPASDGFDRDHYGYYDPYRGVYLYGGERSGSTGDWT